MSSKARLGVIAALALVFLAGLLAGRATAPDVPIVPSPPDEASPALSGPVSLSELPAGTVAFLEAQGETKVALSADIDFELPAPDQDGDRLTDGEESEYGTDPSDPDTDGDRVPDGTEVASGSDPLVIDSDFDYSPELQACVGGAGVVGIVHEALSASCIIATFNPAACTGTCGGTCLGGLFACGWSWSSLQFAWDIANAVPCPGWTCLCP